MSYRHNNPSNNHRKPRSWPNHPNRVQNHVPNTFDNRGFNALPNFPSRRIVRHIRPPVALHNNQNTHNHHMRHIPNNYHQNQRQNYIQHVRPMPIQYNQVAPPRFPFQPQQQQIAQQPEERPVDILQCLKQLKKLFNREEKRQKETSIKTTFDKFIKLPMVNLEDPIDCSTRWNASEILKDFLYIGAGFDKNQRCLVTNSYKLERNDKYSIRRKDYLKDKNILFYLNMAGHEAQKELKDISYDIKNAQSCRVGLNDVDSWAGEPMLEALEKGCDFLNKAYYVHCCYKKKFEEKNPPKVLVHCVAGVNRSAFVVVWWLVKYHKLYLKEAWNLVVERRDRGVGWQDITLGGSIPDKVDVVAKQIESSLTNFYRIAGSKKVDEAARKSQHLFFTGDKENQQNQHNVVSLKLMECSNGALISAKEENKFKKYFWYKRADELLKEHYLVHLEEDSEQEYEA